MAKVELTDVEKWAKRLSRQGPFYLYKTEPYYKAWFQQRYDHELKQSVPFGDEIVQEGTTYFIIWDDGRKTKYGYVNDWMTCRYGVQTCSTLNGTRPQDLWNGSVVDDELFAEMLKVYNGEPTTLPKFELSQLKNLSW